MIEYLPLGDNKRDKNDSLGLSESTHMKQLGDLDETNVTGNKNRLDHSILLFCHLNVWPHVEAHFGQ